jgi:Probable cobalt transporter subunit (CbtB)
MTTRGSSDEAVNSRLRITSGSGLKIDRGDFPDFARYCILDRDGTGAIHRDPRQWRNEPMSDTTFVRDGIAAPIPVREILPWAVFAAFALIGIYFVGVDEGATSIIPGMYLHEFMHDGRHLLGFACH